MAVEVQVGEQVGLIFGDAAGGEPRGQGGHDRQRLQAGLGGDTVADPNRVKADALGGLRHLPVQFYSGSAAFGVYQHASGG